MAGLLEEILNRHNDLLKDEIGKITGITAKLYLKFNAQPKFCKVCPIPFALRDLVENEISQQVKDRILEPVEFSDWDTPVVPILRNDRSVGLCGYYKITVNQVTKTNTLFYLELTT